MSQLLGVERERRKDRESHNDRGQELNSSPSLPLSPSFSKRQLQICFIGKTLP